MQLNVNAKGNQFFWKAEIKFEIGLIKKNAEREISDEFLKENINNFEHRGISDSRIVLSIRSSQRREINFEFSEDLMIVRPKSKSGGLHEELIKKLGKNRKNNRANSSKFGNCLWDSINNANKEDKETNWRRFSNWGFWMILKIWLTNSNSGRSKQFESKKICEISSKEEEIRFESRGDFE